MIIHTKCPTCDKLAQVTRDTKLGQMRIVTYQCGHTVIKPLHSAVLKNFKSLDGKTPYEYQITGAEFIESAAGRCLVADEMGLGKTIQFLLYASTHKDAWPFLVICKSGLRLQWSKEIIRWCGDDFIPQVIDNSRQELIKGFRAYIISLDILRRFGVHKRKCPLAREVKSVTIHGSGSFDTSELQDDQQQELEICTCHAKDTIDKQITAVGIKSICLDECQAIKNSESQRTNQVRKVSQQVEQIVALSGTPIKNNALEYFPVLNILRPDVFPRQARFLIEDVESYWDGYKMKVGGLKNPERFLQKTKDFIIRRERKEVLPDLPSMTRNFRFCDLGVVEEAYIAEFKKFQKYLTFAADEEDPFTRSANTLAYLSRMRHLTGVAKIEPVCEFVEDFLDSTDRKITLFVHHKDVGLALQARLKEACATLTQKCKEMGVSGQNYPEPLMLTAEMDAEMRQEVVEMFMGESGDNYRILIASTLASGEGLNLQKCSDCVMVERQWNPANEEQAEARFIRIGQVADKVTATYFVAIATVDEFFSELVERKREIVTKTLGGESAKWDESSLMKELTDILRQKGGEKWGL